MKNIFQLICHEEVYLTLVSEIFLSILNKVFDEAETLGFNPNLLDIGGGFPGSHNSSLDELADCINKALDEFFPDDSGVKVRISDL